MSKDQPFNDQRPVSAASCQQHRPALQPQDQIASEDEADQTSDRIDRFTRITLRSILLKIDGEIKKSRELVTKLKSIGQIERRAPTGLGSGLD